MLAWGGGQTTNLSNSIDGAKSTVERVHRLLVSSRNYYRIYIAGDADISSGRHSLEINGAIYLPVSPLAHLSLELPHESGTSRT